MKYRFQKPENETMHIKVCEMYEKNEKKYYVAWERNVCLWIKYVNLLQSIYHDEGNV